MLLFGNIPEKGCILGKEVPFLSFHVGCLGNSKPDFPDSGGPVPGIGAPRCGAGPRDSREICPLQYVTHNQWKTTLLRLCLTIAALAFAANSAPAQTYYYPTQPGTYPAQTATPVYYVPTAYANTTAWNGYAPQYYQATYATPTTPTVYTPQYTQATYIQPPPQTAVTQPATTGVQYIPTSYVQTTAQPATTTATTTTATTTTTVATGDPYGFLGWLNATRASYGLSVVGYDPNLESWAAMNSTQQASSGIGHFVMGPARRQNSAMGAFPGIESMWMASPAHREALLDPTIQWIGIAAYGAYWTFNAY